MENSSLANLCRARHLVVGRMQRMVVEQATRGSSPAPACRTSTRSRPTTRHCCGRYRPCGIGCAQRMRPAPRPLLSASCRCTSSSAAPASCCCERWAPALPQAPAAMLCSRRRIRTQRATSSSRAGAGAACMWLWQVRVSLAGDCRLQTPVPMATWPLCGRAQGRDVERLLRVAEWTLACPCWPPLPCLPARPVLVQGLSCPSSLPTAAGARPQQSLLAAPLTQGWSASSPPHSRSRSGIAWQLSEAVEPAQDQEGWGFLGHCPPIYPGALALPLHHWGPRLGAPCDQSTKTWVLPGAWTPGTCAVLGRPAPALPRVSGAGPRGHLVLLWRSPCCTTGLPGATSPPPVCARPRVGWRSLPGLRSSYTG